MQAITDEFMRDRISKSRTYTIVLLRATPKKNEPDADKIVWEHGRRNFLLRAEGVLPIVCPILDDSGVSGIGIFNADLQKTKQIMDEDPGVQAGIFAYEIHPCRSFPGDALPG